MSFVRRFLAQRHARRLRSARALSPGALEATRAELRGMGADSFGPLLECLAHGDARPVALEVLEFQLSDATLERYLEPLGSPNPAIASGIRTVLSTSQRYDPVLLVHALERPELSLSALEGVLQEQCARLSAAGLLEALPKVGRQTRSAVFRLLDRVARREDADALTGLLRDEDPWVRKSLAQLLARLGAQSAVPALVGLLGDSARGVRCEAVAALQALGARSAVPQLAEALRDPDLKVQTAAIDALTALGDVSAVPHLVRVLSDEQESARRSAVEVLNAVATPEAIQDLLRALRDADWWVRVRAADALGTLGGDKVVQAVVGLLRDEDDFIRRHAVEILNAVPNANAVEALLGALYDPDWWVCERAIDALGRTRDARAVQPLLDLMARGGNVLVLCVRALGAIGDPRGLEPLLRLLQSDNTGVRDEALAALRLLPLQTLATEERNRLHEAIGRVVGASGSRPSGPMRVQAGPARDPSAPPANSNAPSAEPRVAFRDGSARPKPAPAPASPVPAPAAPARVVPIQVGDLFPDTVLADRYRMRRRIGGGGFGAVYLFEDTMVHDDVILKILNPQLSQDESVLRRFAQEVRLSRRISHPNIIRTHDFLDLGGAHAVSMEYFPGRDLGKLLAEEGAMEAGRGLRIAAQVCEGLAAAHLEGVIHRDIKPANLLIGDGDEVKIVDFGLASAQQQTGSRLTRSGILIGSPEYMAPEQITGEPVDHRSDLYSLGVVMYELFSGHKPFLADTPVKILYQHLENQYPPLDQRAPGLPPGVVALVTRAMARERDQRQRDAAELAAEIRKEIEALEASVPAHGQD